MKDKKILEQLSPYYFKIVDIWKSFCEEHSKLFQMTCDEYSILLASEIDSLEQILNEKEDLIDNIKHLETKRSLVINEINNILDEKSKINSLSDLINLLEEIPDEKEKKFLERYNFLLIDIIKKIQHQNKKNQIFLNKSIISLREIREGLSGQKNYKTYDNKGLPKDDKVLK